jgi:ribosome-associated protein
MNNITEDEDEWISKSQRKRECDSMQELGEALMSLSIPALRELDLPDNLRSAIEESHKIHQRGALKRHRQFIGKIMRDVDFDEIQKKYEILSHKHDLNNANFKRLEKWRDCIIEQGDSVLNELLSEFPQLDRQHIRQLSRKARKEQESNKPPVAYRQIFKYLRDLAEI